MSEEDKRKAIPEANFRKGVFFALVAGVFSAGMNFGLQGGRALEEAAQAAGTAPQWCGLPVVLLVLWGGFAVEATWCLWRNARNGTFGDYRRIVPLNYLCCAAIGGLWVVQFVCQKAGEPMMGDLRYVSFAVVMASTILGSTVAGLALGEWRGTGVRTRALLGLGMAVMLAGFVAMSLGSR